MKHLTLVFSILMLFASLLISGCSDDSSGPNGEVDEFQDLVGSWDCIEYKYTSVANSALTEDILVTRQITYNLTINSDGSFTVTFTAQGQSFSTSGQMSTASGGGYQTGDPNVSITRSSNQLIFANSNETWDFGSGDEAATLRIAYEKQ